MLSVPAKKTNDGFVTPGPLRSPLTLSLVLDTVVAVEAARADQPRPARVSVCALPNAADPQWTDEHATRYAGTEAAPSSLSGPQRTWMSVSTIMTQLLHMPNEWGGGVPVGCRGAPRTVRVQRVTVSARVLYSA